MPPTPFSPPLDSVHSKAQPDHLKRKSWVATVPPAWGGGDGDRSTRKPPQSHEDSLGGVTRPAPSPPITSTPKSRGVAPTHQTREQRERQETRAKARRYFFIFSSFFPLPGGGTSSPQQPLPRPRWRSSRSRSARMGPSVRRAGALGERLRRGSPPGRPPREAQGSADRDASQGRSGDCRRRRWVRPLARARLLRPSPPQPPHPRPARSSPRSVLPATNGRRVLATQQPIAGRAPTPHTPLSWKETRHPRPAPLALQPGLGAGHAPSADKAPQATPPPPCRRRPRPLAGVRTGSPGTLGLPPLNGPPLWLRAPPPRARPPGGCSPPTRTRFSFALGTAGLVLEFYRLTSHLQTD